MCSVSCDACGGRDRLPRHEGAGPRVGCFSSALSLLSAVPVPGRVRHWRGHRRGWGKWRGRRGPERLGLRRRTAGGRTVRGRLAARVPELSPLHHTAGAIRWLWRWRGPGAWARVIAARLALIQPTRRCTSALGTCALFDARPLSCWCVLHSLIYLICTSALTLEPLVEWIGFHFI